MHSPVSVGDGTKGISGYFFIFAFQIFLCIVFGVLTKYDESLLPAEKNNDTVLSDVNKSEKSVHVPSYPHFQDIHVMIFIGFAFLMTFLKKYGYSATGFNFLLGGLLLQWAIIMRGIFELEEGKINVSLDSMIGADIAVAAVLISMGAVLGRTTPMQLLIMGIFEMIVFAANEYFQLEHMRIADAGGSIVVHSFGAYFGLAVSFMLRPKKGEYAVGPNEAPSYTSDIFAMVGSIFLWIYWPSFNSALLDGSEQQRAILNTYLSLGAATVTSFMISIMVSHERKFDMVHVQNSTLAGGVAVGAVANMLIQPYGAILIGIISGIISVLGYKFLTPAIASKLRISDTCGVHNLHGMPAVLSGIFSAVYAALASKKHYHESLYGIFPAMEKHEQMLFNSTMEIGNSTGSLNETVLMMGSTEYAIGGFGRSAEKQAGYQLLGLLSTVAIAIVAGLLTGLFIKTPSIKRLDKENLHQDSEHWEVPE